MARRLLVPAFLVRTNRRLAPGARVRVRANGRNEAGIVLQSKGRDGYVVLRRRNANEFAGVVSQGLGSTWAGSKYKKTMRRLLFPLGGRATKIAIAAIGAFAVFSGQVETIPVTAVLLIGAELLDQATGGDVKKNPRTSAAGHQADHTNAESAAYDAIKRGQFVVGTKGYVSGGPRSGYSVVVGNRVIAASGAWQAAQMAVAHFGPAAVLAAASRKNPRRGKAPARRRNSSGWRVFVDVPAISQGYRSGGWIQVPWDDDPPRTKAEAEAIAVTARARAAREPSQTRRVIVRQVTR